jgi:hypothetical protein
MVAETYLSRHTATQIYFTFAFPAVIGSGFLFSDDRAGYAICFYFTMRYCQL